MSYDKEKRAELFLNFRTEVQINTNARGAKPDSIAQDGQELISEDICLK
jgi:hypothetical protein